VAAAAVDTGAAMAIALRAAAIGTRRARADFLANVLLKFSNILNSNRFPGMYRYDRLAAVDGSASRRPQGLAVWPRTLEGRLEPFRPLTGSNPV
jgi:hypothetical protein